MQLTTTVNKINEQKEVILDNLWYYYDTAVKPDYNWYEVEARNIYSHLSDIPFTTACGVVAALSPRLNWGRNITAARNLVSNWHLPLEQLTMLTYQFRPNIAKAKMILDMVDVYEIYAYLNAPKTQAFFTNLLDPTIPHATIDTWMIKACGSNKKSITLKEYRTIESAVIELASIAGVLPSYFQATVWENIRN